MNEYHKIQSIYKRSEQTKKFIVGEWSLPEFGYLQNNEWVFTEKVDGTNIRVGWFDPFGEVRFGGKTDNAQLPMSLIEKLQSILTRDKFINLYPNLSMTLYGEGYGAKIQKCGGNYNPNGVDFVLFDIDIGGWWLERENVIDIGTKLGLKIVPIIGEGTLPKAIEMTQQGFNSQWGNFIAEGIVARPKTELRTRNGHRIITKVKHKDWK